MSSSWPTDSVAALGLAAALLVVIVRVDVVVVVAVRKSWKRTKKNNVSSGTKVANACSGGHGITSRFGDMFIAVSCPISYSIYWQDLDKGR